MLVPTLGFVSDGAASVFSSYDITFVLLKMRVIVAFSGWIPGDVYATMEVPLLSSAADVIPYFIVYFSYVSTTGVVYSTRWLVVWGGFYYFANDLIFIYRWLLVETCTRLSLYRCQACPDEVRPYSSSNRYLVLLRCYLVF